MQPGEIVCLYDSGPDSTRTGTVLVSLTNNPCVLFDLPEGTRAILTRLPESEESGDEDPVVEIFVDGVTGFVNFSNCMAL